MHEAGKLADFGAALTTADAVALQEVLGTLNVVNRIEKTYATQEGSNPGLAGSRQACHSHG